MAGDLTGLAALAAFVRDITISGLLIVAIVGGAREWWVYGKHFRDMRADRDFWRDQVLQLMPTARTLIEQAEDDRRAMQARERRP